MSNKKPLQKLELTWIGKGKEPKLEPRILIENPEYSYGGPDSENMLIQGDNLLDYAGKVKCIYIDPPYNTGNAFEHYDRDIITPTYSIPKYVFRGFEKACHFEYKFDSKAEQDLAFVLENDTSVIKWLRPAPNQFRIYWDNNSKRYEPDFIVETVDTFFMIEVKRADQTEEETVLLKKNAAERYCKYASEYTAANYGKKWKYLIIPHNEVSRTVSMSFLATKS